MGQYVTDFEEVIFSWEDKVRDIIPRLRENK
jgi:hypothetical protein